MKTKRLLAVLFGLVLAISAAFALTSCGTSPVQDDEDKELVAVEVENLPDEAIIIGEFDEANITVKLTYDDDTVERFHFTEDMVPERQSHYLREAGVHTVDTMYRGFKLSFTVEMRERYVYEVKFLNALEEVVKTENVVEDSGGATAPTEEEMQVEGYRFLGTFDKDFSQVTENMTVKGEYVKTWKVTFYGADRGAISSYEVDDGESSPEPSEEERAFEGYDFYGWDRDFSEIHKDTKVYGIYYAIEDPQVDQYTINYDLNDEGNGYIVINITIHVEIEITLIEIPEYYNGLPVVAIGEEAFINIENVIGVIIPETVVRIGERAFYGCTGLINIVIRGNLTFIGESAFDGTGYYNDESNWQNGVLYISVYLIRVDINIEIVVVRANTVLISDGAFKGCTVLYRVDISINVLYIGTNAFENCPNLHEIHYGGRKEVWINITINIRIEMHLFVICTDDEIELNYTDNLVYELNADGTGYIVTGYLYPTSLTALYIPKMYLGLPVVGIADGAFNNCVNLIKVEISVNIVVIGRGAFDNTAYYNDNSNWQNGGLYIGKILIRVRIDITEFIILGGTVAVADGAFDGCVSLTSITVNVELRYFSADIFDSCVSLNSVNYLGTSTQWVEIHITISIKIIIVCTDVQVINDPCKENGHNYIDGVCKGCGEKDPDYITSSDYFDFTLLKDDTYEIKAKNTNNLPTYVVIPSTYNGKAVTSIGEDAFYSCIRLTSIEIPDSVTRIRSYAFGRCSKLTSIEIPNGVTSIETGVFYSCSKLTSVTIPNSVTSIGDGAFWVCSSLTSIEIPSGVTSIGYKAFRGCSSLTSIEIPNGVTTIANETFYYCSSLTSVKIPNSVTYIFGDAFCFCSSLTNIEIPNSVTHIGDYMFWGCSSLTNIEISNSVKSIGTADFMECRSLTSIEIPNSVTSIENLAFYGCSSLTSIEIPNSVTSIGEDAFSGCNMLTDVYYGGIAEEWANITIIKGNDCLLNATIHFTEPEEPEQPEPTSSEYFDFTLLNDDTYEIKAKNTNNLPTEIILPSTYNGKAVTSIGKRAFHSCYRLTSIDIPNSVTSIGDYAFYGCGALTNINIPDGTTYIGYEAFEDCISIMSIEIPNSITRISSGAFWGCSSLMSIEIPKSVTNIEDRAFSGCSGLKSIIVSEGNQNYKSENNCLIEKATNVLVLGCKNSIIPNSVTSIGDNAFRGCVCLTSIEIPNSVTSIGDGVFNGCSSLTSIEIPDSVVSIGNYAFLYCSSLTSIKIPNSVTSIGDSEFESCSSLTSIVVPNSVTSIGKRAFSSCSRLMSVTIGDSVTSVGDNAFSSCSGLKSIIVSEENLNYKSENNCLIEKATNALVLGCKNSIIPNSVTSIGNYAFYGCRGLTSIEIPNSVTSIGECAFQGCNSLTSVTIGNGVTDIGSGAFNYCNSLYYVTNRSNLELTFGSKENGYVTYYAKVIVDKDGNLVYKDNSIHIEDDFMFEYISDEYRLIAYLGNEETVTLPLSYSGNSYSIYEMRGVRNVILPQGVTSIGNEAFNSCGSLTSIEIPDSVVSIGNYAFYYCSSLTSIEIPDSVTSIGSDAFRDCNSLTSIEIPDSVTSIGNEAFSDCSRLTSVTIGNGVTSIGYSAFYNCSSLASVTIGNGVTSIGSGAFADCSSITSIEIPSSVTSIGSGAFAGCSSLTSVYIPNGVTSIWWETFFNCISLSSIEIPNSVTGIWDSAFYGCSGLTSINYNGTRAEWQAIDKDTDWKNNVPSDCKVYCIDGTINIGEA